MELFVALMEENTDNTTRFECGEFTEWALSVVIRLIDMSQKGPARPTSRSKAISFVHIVEFVSYNEDSAKYSIVAMGC